MLLLSLLPLTTLVALFLAAYTLSGGLEIIHRIRLAFLHSVLILCVWCVFITEALSYFSLLNFTWILVSWMLPLIISFIYLVKKKALPGVIKEVFAAIFKTMAGSWMIWVIAFILFVSLALAVAYPPNNYDSMTYHMARVAHWQQNQNVSYYQTHILRQLTSPPFAEWAILHLQVLTDSDRLANAVQLFFFAGCLINVSLITKEFGGNARTQILSALITCLLPMAILQSHTTQNDIVVAFFVTAFVYFSIRIIRSMSYSLLAWAGMALGLAFLSKGTGLLFTCLFCGWFILSLLRDVRMPLKYIVKKAALFSCIFWIASIINAGQFYRNTFFAGSMMGNASDGTTNQSFDARNVMWVGVKNFFNHMPVTTGIKKRLVSQADRWGIDANDGRYNMMSTNWMVEGFSFHEDYAQNFVHAILILIAIPLFFLSRRTYNRPPNLYFLFVCTICVTALLYCALLKWQPWSNRLQISLFFLFSVFLAFQLEQVNKWIRLASLSAMMVYAVPSLLQSERHPVLPISHSIFNHPYDYFIYHKGMLECKDYLEHRPHTKLGIIIGSDTWDYPYYRLLAKSQNGPRTIKHVFVKNESSVYLDKFIPDAIICNESRAETYDIRGVKYYRTKIFTDGPVIFERDTTGLTRQ